MLSPLRTLSERLARVLARIRVILAARKLAKLRVSRLSLPSLSDRFLCNPCIFEHGRQIRLIARAVNYRLSACDLVTPTTNAAVDSENDYYTLGIGGFHRLKRLDDRCIRENPLGVLGIEDLRSIVHQGIVQLFGSMACVVDGKKLNTMALVDFDPEAGVYGHVRTFQSPEDRPQEKNWMPFLYGNAIHVIYGFSPLLIYRVEARDRSVHLCGRKVVPSTQANLPKYNGGTNLVETRDGYLGLVHRRLQIHHKKFYLHAFVRLAPGLTHFEVSREFVFTSRGVEFASALLLQDDKVYVGYGVKDSSAFVDSFDLTAVRSFF